MKTLGGPETDRQRSERLWATMQDLRREKLSRSMHAATRTGAVVKDDRDAAEQADHIDIFPVTAAEIIKAGDVLFLSCAKASINRIEAPDDCSFAHVLDVAVGSKNPRSAAVF